MNPSISTKRCKECLHPEYEPIGVRLLLLMRYLEISRTMRMMLGVEVLCNGVEFCEVSWIIGGVALFDVLFEPIGVYVWAGCCF